MMCIIVENHKGNILVRLISVIDKDVFLAHMTSRTMEAMLGSRHVESLQ